jgi:pimeloyl-ACP methyl ester carboxylesterase
MTLEQRVRDCEAQVFASLGVDVEESFISLPRTRANLRVLSHGSGPPLVLLHGVTLSAVVWAQLFKVLTGWRSLALDLPGHGLSDPTVYRPGRVREHARRMIDDVFDVLGIDRGAVVGHSLGGMFALWYAATGAGRISDLVAVGDPAVALPGVRVRVPLSLLTVPGLGQALLRFPGPPAVYRRLLAMGLGSAEVAAAPQALVEALRLSGLRTENAKTVNSLMHAIDRFRRPRPESVLTGAELEAISTAPMFIWGSDDPYLSPDEARPSIDRIGGAALHELHAGHGPWLVDAESVARLIQTHLAAGS